MPIEPFRCVECDFEQVDEEGDTCEHCLEAYEEPEDCEYEDD